MMLLKKIFFGILIASALFGGTYLFLNAYNPEIQTYETYKSYLIFLYISIILVYLAALSDKRIAKPFIFLIILSNFIRLTSFFTQDTLGLSTKEFSILTGLLIVGFIISYIRFRIRYILIITVGIPFIIILLNHILPLYPDKPDIYGFYETEVAKLTIQSSDTEKTLQDTESKVTIKSSLDLPYDEQKTLTITTGYINETLGEAPLNIDFSAKSGLQNTYVYITFPQGQIITLYPQSAVSIKRPISMIPLLTEINIIQGKANIYIPLELSGNIILTGNTSGLIEGQTDMIPKLIEAYTLRRNNYFIKQIGGKIMLNPNVDAFIGWYLALVNSTYSLAGKIENSLPKYFDLLGTGYENSYLPNILNYNEFHTYLDYQTNAQYTDTGDNTTRMLEDTQKGFNATKTKGRIDSIRNLLNF